jgi:putative hemolysin
MIKIKKMFFVIFCFMLLFSIGCTRENNSNNNTNTQIPNPASVHCIESGGELEIRTDETGGQYGVCIKNGQECEEWAYYRGECMLE